MFAFQTPWRLGAYYSLSSKNWICKTTGKSVAQSNRTEQNRRDIATQNSNETSAGWLFIDRVAFILHCQVRYTVHSTQYSTISDSSKSMVLYNVCTRHRMTWIVVSTGLPPSPLPLPASSTSGVKVKGGNSSARISQEANAPQHFSGKKISKRTSKQFFGKNILRGEQVESPAGQSGTSAAHPARRNRRACDRAK